MVFSYGGYRGTTYCLRTDRQTAGRTTDKWVSHKLDWSLTSRAKKWPHIFSTSGVIVPALSFTFLGTEELYFLYYVYSFWHFTWMSTVVLYCWCHSDSASVLLYFTFLSHLFPLPCGAGSTVPREGFDSSVIMPFSWCVVAVTLPI